MDSTEENGAIPGQGIRPEQPETTQSEKESAFNSNNNNAEAKPVEKVDGSFMEGKWWGQGPPALGVIPRRKSESSFSSKPSKSSIAKGIRRSPSTPATVLMDKVSYGKNEEGEKGKPYSVPLEEEEEEERGSKGSTTEVPKTPVERVRFILQENEEGDEVDYDHDFNVNFLRIHALFCQLDVLCHFEEGDTGWKQMARWLKYEEKVESGNRWSKPHVATTSLHALFELRKGLAEGTLIVDLNLEATHGCLHQVAGMQTTEDLLHDVAQRSIEVIRNSKKGLSKEKLDKIFEILIKPHKHKDRKGRKHKNTDANNDLSLFFEGPNTASSTPKKTTPNGRDSENNEDEIQDSSTVPLKSPPTSKKSRIWKPHFKKKGSLSEISALQHSYPGGIAPDELDVHKPNKRLMKKIPGGSEAANILIGNVDFLDEPIMVFLRLVKPHVLADLTEVALPTRFLFLALGPAETNAIWEYEEVGRAMATLLSDRVFCELAYKAKSRQDLVDGMDEFIDDLTVLPPSIWDPTTRLEPPEEAMSIDKIQRRLLDSSRHAAGEEAFHFAESAGDDESIQRTGRLCGGLIKDIKRRGRLYLSDITDAFHIQCLASIVFLYFACITPIVTFGGLLGDGTGGNLGTMESLLAGAICGSAFALFSGQPLIIVGATGPLLIFETLLYSFCDSRDWDFLSFRCWIGIWVAGILLVFVIFDLSALVRFITRFTEESFAVLISLIFIVEAFKKVAHIWDTHPIHVRVQGEAIDYTCHCDPPLGNVSTTSLPTTTAQRVINLNGTEFNSTDGYNVTEPRPPLTLYNWTTILKENCVTYTKRLVVGSGCLTEDNCTENGWRLSGPACNVFTVTHSVPDVFFFCCFLFIGTFVIAFFFRSMKRGLYFPTIVRSTLSDFAVLLAILTCTGVDALLGLETPKLNVPSEFKTTIDSRTWFVNPADVTYWWLPIIALLPALLAVILIYLDQQITAVIVNRKEHKLQKGHGYHLDLLVLAITLLLCSLMGLPWFVAATVRSVTHVRSLIRESELRAPGERSQMLGVREQRVTGFCIHLLIGVSTLLTGVLKHVPMAVLYGVFLYMGVTSLSGVQFVQRISILFMPVKYQPDYTFLRHVATKRVHMFTLIQVVCMVCMWTVKSISEIAIAFPLLILAVCFVRKGLDYFYTQSELYWLDHILPDDSKKKKEEGEDLIEDEAKNLKLDDAEATPYMKKDIKDEIVLGDEWDQLIAKRDYGVGKKPRARKMSQDIIARHRGPKFAVGAPETDGSSMDSSQDASHLHRRPQPFTSFKDRKFSF